ncbi:MAG: DUF4440 domain-containing protein [Bacillota bacterium]
MSLVQNEYAFARDVAEHGIRDGFLMHLDKQSITFAPKPVNAFDFYAQKKPNSTKLDWYPVYAVVSADGAFGVDTGPWTASYTQDGTEKSANGEWLTVWAKDQSGAWHALFDGGVTHAAPESPVKGIPEDAPVMQLPALTAPASGVDATQAQIAQQENQFSDDAAHGLKAAYEAAAAADIHVLLDNGQPLLGREEALTVMPAMPAGLHWVPMGGSVARSGDLGYVYGMTYKTADEKHASPVGVYMHVWRRDQDGWKLLISEDQPLPPAKN